MKYKIGGISIYNSSKYEEMVYEIEYINFFNDNVVFKSIFPKCFFRNEKEFIYPNSAFTIEVNNVKTDISENLSKYYRLGVINNGTLFRDIQTWWALKRGKDDPHSKIGQNKYIKFVKMVIVFINL